jgi:hypothetical protein
MTTKMEEFTINNSEEFNQMIEHKDIRISKALVSAILRNLKGKKRHIPAMSVFVEEEQILLDVTVDRKDFEYVLKTHLPTYEQYELYEECSQIVKALDFLKENQKK